MPAARGEPAEKAASRGFFVKVKHLRIERARKHPDLALVHLLASARESQADAKVLEVEIPIGGLSWHAIGCLSETDANARSATIGDENARIVTMGGHDAHEFREFRGSRLVRRAGSVLPAAS